MVSLTVMWWSLTMSLLTSVVVLFLLEYSLLKLRLHLSSFLLLNHVHQSGHILHHTIDFIFRWHLELDVHLLTI